MRRGVRYGGRGCEDGEDGSRRWRIELNLRVKSDGPLSWLGWLIKVCFLGKVPTFAGQVPLDRADVAEVGFAVGQPGERAGKAGQERSTKAQTVVLWA